MIYVVSFVLIATKLADVLTTIHVIENEEDIEEANPLVRMMMNRLGERRAMWATFGISLVLFLGLTLFTLVNEESAGMFILFGFVISILQGAVAHTNWTGNDNLITRVVFAYFSWHENLFSKIFSAGNSGSEE